ncbi:hypothetical protein ASF49_03955 [Methylobacterium sp. Leaf104]|nr:hypothetical protein ASF49_03955 [Methylobacterium sp. Leaf104]
MVEGKRASVEQAAADHARYAKLSDAAVSQQKVEAAQATGLEAKATYDQAMADRDVDRLNLAHSAVKASANGRITNMGLARHASCGPLRFPGTSRILTTKPASRANEPNSALSAHRIGAVTLVSRDPASHAVRIVARPIRDPA